MWINHLLNNPPAQYADLSRRCAQWCARLAGVKSVALWLDDARELTAIVLAAWQVGAQVRLLPNTSAASLAWANEAEMLISDTLPQAKKWDNVEQNQHNITFRLPENASVLLQTSGSAGQPKVVAKTCAQMCCEADAVAQTLPENWRDVRVLASVSPQHLYGFTFRVWVAMRMGWAIEAETLRYPEDFYQKNQDDCLWLSSPAVLNHMHIFAQAPAGVRGVVSAGGVLPDASMAWLTQTLCLPLRDVYGSTETGVVAWRSQAGDYQFFPTVQAHTDESQCLRVRSDWVVGEQETADVASVLGDTLRLHGRHDRVLKLGDKRVSLDDIAQQIGQHEWVDDVHTCLHRGRVAAWVALSAAGMAHLRQHGRVAMIRQWRQFLRPLVERVALPRYWRLTAQALPRNAQSKLRAQDVAAVLQTRIIAPDWQCVHRGEHEAHFSGSVPVDLVYFDGHFADFPLVAGVVQVQWVMDLAAGLGWVTAPVVQMENLKYQHFVRPNDTIVAQLRWDASKGKLIFAILLGEQTCSSGRVVFQAA